ncbi:MAG: patatin-like phospholipase family protein [Pseudomonadota bacterium]
MRLFGRSRPLNLALQGGGAHGAYTWGVLDRLLEDDRVEPGWLSGTSSGSVNAAALASGWTLGGRDKAREVLAGVWKDIAGAGVPDFVKLNPFYSTLSRSSTMAQMASMFSPYDFNPMGFDPLRSVLETWIDFKAIRQRSSIELIIPATDARTGQARFFNTREISVETVMASSCLPALHQAVEIDGESYWDGGFSSNPDVLGLAKASPVRDTMIVQLTPLKRAQVPTNSHGISDHVYHLAFLAPLIRDIEIIENCREACGGGLGIMPRSSGPGRVADHRFHVIDATPHTVSMDWSSKVNPEWDTFQKLFEAGREDATAWLEKYFNDIGRRETIDLRKHFLARSDVPALTLPKPPGEIDDDGHDAAMGTVMAGNAP